VRDIGAPSRLRRRVVVVSSGASRSIASTSHAMPLSRDSP
jgi:hypothetical protein